jgi:hypothetical protein
MGGLCSPAIVSFASSEEHVLSTLPALPYRPSLLQRVRAANGSQAPFFLSTR